MKPANPDCLDRFFRSDSLCLENCHADRNRTVMETSESENIILNQDAPDFTVDALSTNSQRFQLAISDLIRATEGGSLDRTTAYFAFSTLSESLYKRRNESSFQPITLWVLRGLWVSIDILQLNDKKTHFPFLIKLINFLEKNDHYLDAIEMCDYALDNKVPDSTASGYKGRKRRVENKMAKNEGKQKIDWEQIRSEAREFF